MRRTILHSDINAFYASVECSVRPELAHLPVAVTGDPELRHGIVSSLARVRTWSRAIEVLARHTRALAPLERLAVMNSNCTECAADLLGRIEAILPPGGAVTTSATTVIGTHVGPGAVGIAAVTGRAGS
mgnify:CR=1 FL=1